MPRKRFRRLRRYSPRRQYRRFRRGKAPIPLLPLAGGVIAPMADSFNRAGGLPQLQSDPMKFGMGFIDQVCQHYTGFSINPQLSGVTGWNSAYLANTYGGLIAGVIGHKLLNKVGVNRYIRKLPVVGKWVTL